MRLKINKYSVKIPAKIGYRMFVCLFMLLADISSLTGPHRERPRWWAHGGQLYGQAGSVVQLYVHLKTHNDLC
jgi:hypothetical protein